MPILYRGEARGKYGHTNDARIHGFTARSPTTVASTSLLINHIAHQTTYGPFISLTSSFGIARDYALMGPAGVATPADPGYVYIIDIPNPLPPGVRFRLLDPVKEIIEEIPDPPQAITYQHGGTSEFLLGLIDPIRFGSCLVECSQTPDGLPHQASNSSLHLRSIVRAARDAELLVDGLIPRNYVVNRIDVY